MRNLKKVLSLVLCMAMMLSVMVVGAGAAFKDQNKIVNEEAVDMCSALNIINGYTDGSYRPEGNITRAEACKMICIALNGGQDPVLGTNATPTFTDIKGHWAEKYIEYCVSKGIVAGVGGGKFAPAGNVTGSQFAKMLLIAMGYRADAEDFVGSAWEVNVNVTASAKGLYKDLATMNPAVALTRDNAAQMVWNALNADMVKYDYKLSTVNGTLTSELVVEDIDQTLLEKKYAATNMTGIMTGIEYVTKDEEYKYTTEKGTFTTEADYTDLLGHNVTFVIKGNDKADVYGAYAEDSEVLASGLIGDIDDLDGFVYGTDTTIEIDDVEYDIDKNVAAFAFDTNDSNKIKAEDARLTSDQFKAEAAYNEFVAIDNDDDDSIDVVIVYPVPFGEVTYVGSDYVRADNNVGKLGTDEDEYTVYNGVAKEDMVLVSPDTTLKTWGTISKLDKQTEKLNSVSSDGSVVLGDKAYDLALPTGQSLDKDNLDKTVEFYAINGYVVDADTTTSVDMSDYVMVTGVTGATASNGYYQADLLFTDGTTASVSIANSAGTKGSLPGGMAPEALPGTIWTYEIDGGKYELTAVTKDKATTGFDLVDYNCAWQRSDSTSDANAKITVEGSKVSIASDAVIFVVDGDDYSVKTGADLAKVTGNATIKYAGAEENSNGYTYVTFALVYTSNVSSSDEIYGFVTSDIKTVKDSDGTYYTFTAWNGEKSVDLKTANVNGSDFTGDMPTKQAIITYKVNADGAVTYIDVVEGNVTAITAYDGGKNIKLGGTEYEIDKDDTTILFIDRDGKSGEATGTINIADKADTDVTATGLVTVGSDKYYANAQFVAEGSAGSTLKLLVVDVTNDWYAVND